MFDSSYRIAGFDDELAAAGIGPGTIRVSIGIEDAEDLINDIDYALSCIA